MLFTEVGKMSELATQLLHPSLTQGPIHPSHPSIHHPRAYRNHGTVDALLLALVVRLQQRCTANVLPCLHCRHPGAAGRYKGSTAGGQKQEVGTLLVLPGSSAALPMPPTHPLVHTCGGDGIGKHPHISKA